MRLSIKISVLCLFLGVFGLQAGASESLRVAQSGSAPVDESELIKPRFRFSSQAYGDVERPSPDNSSADSSLAQSDSGREFPPSTSPAARDNALSLEQAVQAREGQGSGGSSRQAEGFALGQGDVVGFSMFGQPDMDTTAFVSSSGTVSLPLIGEVEVAGLTPVEAEKRIAQAFAEGGFFRDPQVNITIEQYRSRQVSVLGEVAKPGRYPLETQTTVLDVLAQAGGRTNTGSSVVTVVRNDGDNTVRHSIDLNRLFRSKGSLGSLSLQAGDIVFVPEAELFYIYGEVRKPDSYAIKPGMTVMQAISLGGGVTERGSNSRIELRRKNESGEIEKYSPELTDRIQSDDVIFVKERFF